mgnify:CR=1 FL=1|tara:strand:- start:41 stop:655 length:615 start_codon:yes stop_codon:yes gene_type:complete
MSLDPKGSVQIEQRNLYPTPIWITNLVTNTQQDKKVSLNEDLLSFIRGEFEKSPEIIEKSNRGGGWQSRTNLQKEPAVKELGQQIYNVCKTIFPHIKGMRVEQMWAAINFEHSWNKLHSHGDYHMSGAYYLQVPVNSGRISYRDPREGAINNVWCSTHIDKGEWAWFEPKESDLMIWPAHLPHMVEPSKSKDPRVMISFDIKFT